MKVRTLNVAANKFSCLFPRFCLSHFRTSLWSEDVLRKRLLLQLFTWCIFFYAIAIKYRGLIADICNSQQSLCRCVFILYVKNSSQFHFINVD